MSLIVSETEALWCVENHQEYLEKCTILFSGLGYSLEQVALLRVCKLDEVAPSYDDVKTVNGHDYRRWKVNENGLLLDSSFAEFVKTEKDQAKNEKFNKGSERAVLVKVLMRRSLDNLPGAEAALATHDLFIVWPFILLSVSLPGASSAIRALSTITGLRESGRFSAFNAYTNAFRATFKDFSEHLECKDMDERGVRYVPDGYVRLSNLSSLIFSHGIKEEDDTVLFQYPLDRELASIDTVHELAVTSVLIGKFFNFLQNVRTTVSVHEPAIGFIAPAVGLLPLSKSKAR